VVNSTILLFHVTIFFVNRHNKPTINAMSRTRE